MIHCRQMKANSAPEANVDIIHPVHFCCRQHHPMIYAPILSQPHDQLCTSQPHLHMQLLPILLRLIPTDPMRSRLQMRPRDIMRSLRHTITPSAMMAMVCRLHMSRTNTMVARPCGAAIAVIPIVFILRAAISGTRRNHRGGGIA